MKHPRDVVAARFKRAKAKSWKYITKYCPTYVSKSVRFRELVLSQLKSDMDMIDLGFGTGFVFF